MVLLAYCKQHIVQLYFERRVILAAEGLKSSKEDNMGNNQEVQEALNPFLSSWKWSTFQASAWNPGHHWRTHEDGQRNYSHSACEVHECWRLQCLQDYDHLSVKNSRVDFHGSRYCQMIRDQDKKKQIKWARENLNNKFDDIVWTDESMIQLENHQTFWCGRVFSEKAITTTIPHPQIQVPTVQKHTVVAVANPRTTNWSSHSSVTTKTNPPQLLYILYC